MSISRVNPAAGSCFANPDNDNTVCNALHVIVKEVQITLPFEEKVLWVSGGGMGGGLAMIVKCRWPSKFLLKKIWPPVKNIWEPLAYSFEEYQYNID